MHFSVGRDYLGWNIHTVAEASPDIDPGTKQPSEYLVRGFAEFHRSREFIQGYINTSRIDLPDLNDRPFQFTNFKIAQDFIFALLEEAIDLRKRS